MADKFYSTGDVSERFGVKRQTVRRWAEEYFADFLSPEANPGEGRNKKFTDADLTVFGLWIEGQSRGLTVEEVKAALRNGDRGEIPLPPLSKSQQELALSQVITQNVELKSKIERLEEEIKNIGVTLNKKNEEVASEKARGDIMEQQYQSAQKRVEEMIVELALLKRQINKH